MPAKPPATPSGDATGASLFHFKLLPVKSSSNTASVRNPGLASPLISQVLSPLFTTAALNDVQVEVNYAIKLDDQWTVRPGMLTHFSSNGTRYGPYVKLSWDATKDLNFGIRYRYDWKAYRQQDLSGDMSRDNVHRWDGYVTYHINSDFTFAWQTTLYSKQNDYRYANHKKWATENAFVLQYHMTPDITPYIEYDYLDRQGVYNGRDNLSENSYRIGVSFKL